MLSMATVKVSKKNQIAVPSAVRRQLGIKAGDRLEFEVEDSRLILRPSKSWLEEWKRLGAEVGWTSEDSEYVRKLRDEWE